MSDSRLSRRDLFTASAAACAVTVLKPGAAEARSYSGEVPWAPGEANAPRPVAPGPYQFFTADEAAFIDAAVARLVPADELGPGAKEAGVTTFLDRQLAGSYGKAQRWYMQGPWQEGDKTQGYQSRLTPAQLYRAGIKAIDDHCRKQYQDKAFTALSTDRQDEVLTALEKGDLKLPGLGPHPIEIENAAGDTFFSQLMQNTIEGFFADPLYGGNKDMIGWKLIGFPGARYNYLPYVSEHGKKLALDPVGIEGRAAWTPQGS